MESSTGTRVTARTVVDDATALIRAELALAKAEFEQAAREKAKGAGLLAGAGVVGWLGLQGLLITIALGIFALGLPGWAAAGIVTLVLLVVAGVLALLGRKRARAKLSLDTTKQSVQEDVAWTKSHLPSRTA